MRPRLLAVLGAVLSLAVGAAVAFGLMVADDAMRSPNAFGGPLGMLIVALVGLFIPGLVTFFLGLAIVPTRVREAGRHRAFAAACTLLVVALACFAAVMLFFITWPLGALFLVGSVLLFRYSLRRGAVTEPPRTPSP